MVTTHTDVFNKIMERSKPTKKKKQIFKQIEPRENMNELQNSISKCLISENIVKLPIEQLTNYKEVKKALLNAGGKYQRNSFIFPSDAKPFIDRLMNGESVNIKKEFQFFATPSKLAKRIINNITFFEGAKVGEFSAGQGAFLDELPKLNLKLTVCELMKENAKILKDKNYNVVCANFLLEKWQMQDIIIGNPPFNKNQDIKHFMHMYKHLKKGGRMDVITSPHWTFASEKICVEFRKFLNEKGATWKEIDAGEFKESGTNIKTVLITLINN